ncbi:MAG: hypothetical protein HY327_05615 [Chloroflexi bacterium]|nr:hypothetical protein [Chloroflexota bacterium]
MKLTIFPFLALLPFALSLGIASASTLKPTHPQTLTLDTRRCANDYSDEEIIAIRDAEDGYEPDDCMMLASPLTGPELHFFCASDDEDWAKFTAQPNLIYEISATPRFNYPTAPRLELIEADGARIAQNDHYFGNDAAIWFWDAGAARTVYLRVTEMNYRAECGNDEYTLRLRVFYEKP